jgi:hypothetical protein
MSDNVETKVHSVGKVNVRAARWPKHYPVSRSLPSRSVTCGIVASSVRLSFNYSSNQPIVADESDQPLSKNFSGHGDGIV